MNYETRAADVLQRVGRERARLNHLTMVLDGIDSCGVEEHSTLVAVSEKSPPAQDNEYTWPAMRVNRRPFASRDEGA